MNEREQWALRERQRPDLQMAARILRGMATATPPESEHHVVMAAMADAVEEACRWLGTVHGGAEPVAGRFATPAQQARHGATHVLFQRVAGMEPVRSDP